MRRRFELITLALALAGVCAIPSGCSNAAIEADRQQQQVENSPEVKRQQREAARKGMEGTAEALQGMEGAFGAESKSQPAAPDAQQQPDKAPEEIPK
jgi:hypothetical protein